MKPTDKQIKEFWELIGFKVHSEPDFIGDPDFATHYWVDPDGKPTDVPLLPIDLNNLFKYARNMFFERGWSTSWYDLLSQWVTFMFNNQDEDPTLALFWAIYEVMKRSDK